MVGFPGNDFGGQKPGAAPEIRRFCARLSGMTFSLAAKVRINGMQPHPIYRWLMSKAENGRLDSAVS